MLGIGGIPSKGFGDTPSRVRKKVEQHWLVAVLNI